QPRASSSLPCEGRGGLGRGAVSSTAIRGHPLPASPCLRRGGPKRQPAAEAAPTKPKAPRPGPGREGGSVKRSALLAHPHLLPADEGDAAGHAQLAAALEQFDLGPVGLALGGVEHGAAAPLVAV